MPYEPGSYLQELEEEHAQGNHKDYEDDNCPLCREKEDMRVIRSEGFRSREAYEKAAWKNTEETALALEDVLEAHRRGEHRDTAPDDCIHPECLSRD
jgi:hypothetical protein